MRRLAPPVDFSGKDRAYKEEDVKQAIRRGSKLVSYTESLTHFISFSQHGCQRHVNKIIF